MAIVHSKVTSQGQISVQDGDQIVVRRAAPFSSVPVTLKRGSGDAFWSVMRANCRATT
jgi:hypothetical protein